MESLNSMIKVHAIFGLVLLFLTTITWLFLANRPLLPKRLNGIITPINVYNFFIEETKASTIFSAPLRRDRRDAIRDSRMTMCKVNRKVVGLFVTDGLDEKGQRQRIKEESPATLLHERHVYNDIILAESPAGLNFGQSILWTYEWSNERYNFLYISRLDVDYFLCLDKLLMELQDHRPKKLFTWACLRCQVKYINDTLKLSLLMIHYDCNNKSIT